MQAAVKADGPTNRKTRYKAHGTHKLARHSVVRYSVPQINGPVVQHGCRSLLRKACGSSPLATGRWRPATVVAQEQESAEAIVQGDTSRGPEIGPCK